MKLQILVSTYQSRLFKNLKQVEQLKNYEHVIVDQSPLEGTQYPAGYNVALMRNSKGLTKSRNKALSASKGELLLISDDDLEYTEDFSQQIITAFKENPNAAVISFQVLKPDGTYFKNYKSEQYIHTKRTAISTSSVELVFRRKILVENEIKFDEKFGVNAKFPCGEEAVLLGEIIDLGLEALYVPVPICIHPEESSGKDYDRSGLLLAKGAMIKRLFGAVGFFLLFAFIAKNFKKIFSSKARIIELFQGYFLA
jgi:GT2 family glycosyltransferase